MATHIRVDRVGETNERLREAGLGHVQVTPKSCLIWKPAKNGLLVRGWVVHDRENLPRLDTLSPTKEAAIEIACKGDRSFGTEIAWKRLQGFGSGVSRITLKMEYEMSGKTESEQASNLSEVAEREVKRALSQMEDTATEEVFCSIVEQAAEFWSECPDDFCVQHITGGTIVFGSVNRVVWSPLKGFALDPGSCTPNFKSHFCRLVMFRKNNL